MITITPGERVLIIAPHPDDESLACGALIQHAVAAGARVRVLFLTNGEKNPWPQRYVERRWRISAKDGARWGERRRAEALAALGSFGLDEKIARFLYLPDTGLTRLLMQGGRSIVALLAGEMADFQPTLVVGPAGRDTHPDHSAAHVLLQLALRQHGASGIRYLDYVVHGKPFALTATSVVIQLSPEEVREKLSAILCHATQMSLSRGRFCGYARPTELFHVVEPLRDEHPTHPIYCASEQDDTLILKVRHSWPAFSTRRILLAIEGETGQPARWSLPLPMKSGKVPLRDERSRETVCEAAARWTRECTELRVPLAGLPRRTAIFAKLDGSRLFFDQAGWRDVPTEQHSTHLHAQIDRAVEIQALVSSFYSRPQPSAIDATPNMTISLLSSDVRACRGSAGPSPHADSTLPPADLRSRRPTQRIDGKDRN